MPSLCRMRAGWGAGKEEGGIPSWTHTLPQSSDSPIHLVQVFLDARNGWTLLGPLGQETFPLVKVTAVEEGKGSRT